MSEDALAAASDAGTLQVVIALAVFVVTYALIISERIHKTTAALVGGMAVIALRVIDSEQAFEAIDFTFLFLERIVSSKYLGPVLKKLRLPFRKCHRIGVYPPMMPLLENTICHSCIFRTREEPAPDSRK